MRITHLKFIAVTGMVMFLFSLKAQSGEYITIRDFETWSSVAFRYKPNKKVKLGLEQQLRLKNNSSSVQQYFTSLTGQYKISTSFRLGAEGRYIRNNDDQGKIQGYENHFRWAAYTSFQHDIKRVELNYRLQYQNKNELGISTEQGDLPIKKLRLKVEAKYNFPKWKVDPKISGEIFRNIGDINQFSKIRGTIGTNYSIKNTGTVGAFFRIEKELNKTYPQTTHIIGLNFTYTIKKKKND